MSKRTEELYGKYVKGKSVRDLAKEFSICQTRVRQIIKLEERKSLESHTEKEILDGCISLMNGLYSQFLEYLEFMDIDINNCEENEVPVFNLSYGEIVQRLFLMGTSHSGGGSTSRKCSNLGVDYSECVTFEPEDL